jgi:hypothetical protein
MTMVQFAADALHEKNKLINALFKMELMGTKVDDAQSIT